MTSVLNSIIERGLIPVKHNVYSGLSTRTFKSTFNTVINMIILTSDGSEVKAFDIDGNQLAQFTWN